MEGFLQKDGKIVIDRRQFKDIPFLMQLGSEVASARKGKPLPGIKK